MSRSRREFLVSSAALLGAGASQAAAGHPPAPKLPSGSPPVFGTAPGVGPQVAGDTLARRRS